MDEKRQLSRTDRQRKRRKNQRIIYSFILLALLFFIILLILIFTGSGDDHETIQENKENNEVNTDENLDEVDKENSIDHEDSFGEVNEEDESLEEIVIQYIDSDDPNVIEAYVGNWPPMGTTQEEPHVTDFTKDSTDWIEMRNAVIYATNINEEDLIELWFGNGGEQKVIATVKDRSTNEIFRVYLSWIEHSGWQPTLVEKLKEYNP